MVPIGKFAGAVRSHQTNELRGTVMPRLRRVTHMCSSKVTELRIGKRKGRTSIGPSLRIEKSSAVLFFEAVAGLWSAPDYLRKGVIHKRVETLVSTLLCPCRAGKIRSLRKRQTFVYNDLTNPKFDFRTHAKK